MRRLLLLVPLVLGLLPTPVSAGGGGHGCSDPSQFVDAEVTSVTMKMNCFGPTVARVDAGEKIAFTNDDLVPHTVGGAAATFGNVYEEIKPGESAMYTFDEPGIYPYVCALHPGMAGAIVVGNGIPPGGTAASLTQPVEPPASASDVAAPPADDVADTDWALVGAGGATVAVLAGVALLVRRARRRPHAATM